MRILARDTILNTETACIARANPYDLALQIATAHKTGCYLFNLIIGGYWGEIYGIFYPEGTVRDPSIVAAIMGFYRNRDLNTIRPIRIGKDTLRRLWGPFSRR